MRKSVKWQQEIERAALRRNFQNAMPFKRTDRSNATALGMFLGKVLPAGYPDDRRVRSIRFYGLPPLAEFHLAFEQKTATHIDWPDEDEKVA